MKKTILKLLTVAAITTLTICCGPNPDKIPILTSSRIVPIWQYHQYDQCEPSIREDVKELPFDVAFQVNRNDLPRYDTLNTLRVWAISKNLKLKDVTSHLVDKEKEGQVSISLARWVPDSHELLVNWEWVEPQHAMHEESVKGVILEEGKRRTDLYKVNVDTLESKNLTIDPEVSFYNAGAVFLPSMPGKFLFAAYLNGVARTHIMNLDGSDKKLFLQTEGYTYGVNVSPDGSKIAFHSDYRVFIKDLVSKTETQVNTPCVFNFSPVWSPDSQRIVFSCGPSNVNPDLYTADRNGQDVRFLASRNGYSGAIPFTSQYDYHDGGSDRFVWMPDSSGVIHGKLINGAVELVSSRVNGTQERLTYTQSGDRNVFPQVSKDNQWLLFNSKREGKAQELFVKNLQSGEETQITDMREECDSRFGFWR